MQKIMVSAEEQVCCPKCSHCFPLQDGITRQTLERYENDYDAEFKKREEALKSEIQRDLERRLKKGHESELQKIREELEESTTARKELLAKIESARNEARSKAVKEFEDERVALRQDLESRETQIKTFRENELKLRKEKQALETAQADLELELNRRLDEEKKKIEQQVQHVESERFRMKEAEYRKKIEDAQRANEDLTRKLEQGSQQLQGEVLELELEDILRTSFPLDIIEPVRKGARGADVVQTVMTRSGQVCGKIIWEAKRAENWSNNWIPKLKEDQQAANAEVAALVTTVMPKQSHDPFVLHEGVWVVTATAIRPVAETLRVILLEQQKSRAISVGKNEKMEALYDYLCSPQFAQRIRAVVEAYTGMKRDLDSERAALEKIWKKREKQIERVTMNMMGMCGEIQAISHDAMPQLNDVGELQLTGGDRESE